jgi:hypothetical protein
MVQRQTDRWFQYIPIAIVCIAAGLIRLSIIDWDQGGSLHPDERHLLFNVRDALSVLGSATDSSPHWLTLWFATGESPLDPRAGEKFFVYGELPYLGITMLAYWLGLSKWLDVQMLARSVTALLDTGTVLAVYLVALATTRDRLAALLAAALYAASPLALQHSSFFTVDAWLTGLGAWGLLACIALQRSCGKRSFTFAAIAGVLAGLSIACKLPGLALLPVIAAAVVTMKQPQGVSAVPRRTGVLLTAGASAYASLRIASPFMFSGAGGLYSLLPSSVWLSDLRTLSRLSARPDFPPNLQWMAEDRFYKPLLDLAVWGVGLAASGIVALATLLQLAKRHPVSGPAMLCLVYGGLHLIYFAVNPVPVLRYALPAIPIICVLGGSVVVGLRRRVARGLMAAIAAGLAMIWGAGLVEMHWSEHSRVSASRWLWLNTKPGTAIAFESEWDERLPLPIDLGDGEGRRKPDHAGHFRFENLQLELPDTADKAAHMVATLDKSDLVVISSGRFRDHMPRLPARFPLTTAYYTALSEGDLCFKAVLALKPGYRVLGFTLDDSSAQEPWTVYDHPTVEIFRKLPCFDAGNARALFERALAGSTDDAAK